MSEQKRDRALHRAGAVLMGVAAGMLCLSAPAQAFVIDAPDGGSGDAFADLAAAARWDANASSLVESGERGLGGGLEYAVDDSVCTQLRFVGEASCEAIKAQIAEAARRWGAGHPALSFVDVTGSIAPELAPEDGGWIGHGAEIDFFAAPGQALELHHDDYVAADTRSYYLFEPAPRDPLGRQTEARGRITAADVRFNADRCFYLDADAEAPGCAHFGSVVMHELAHVLGLDHPDQYAARNLTAVIAPQTDCGPTTYAASGSTERFAVANGRWRGAGYWTRGLTVDDYAGRDALYPACGIDAQPPVTGGARRWAAFAIGGADGENVFGWARDFDTEEGARRRAEVQCAQYGEGCEVAAVFAECFAFARGEGGIWGWAVRPDIPAARAGAVANCSVGGRSCEAPIAMCATPSEAG